MFKVLGKSFKDMSQNKTRFINKIIPKPQAHDASGFFIINAQYQRRNSRNK